MSKAKGTVAFESLGKNLLLSFSINALCELEDELDMPVSQVGTVLTADMRLKTLRTIFRIGLIDEQPGVTDNEAGLIISDIGPERAGELMAEAFSAAFPDQAAGGSNVAPNPRKGTKAAGIGLSS